MLVDVKRCVAVNHHREHQSRSGDLCCKSTTRSSATALLAPRFASTFHIPAPGCRYEIVTGYDSWQGYTAERERFYKAVIPAGGNAIVYSGAISASAAKLRAMAAYLSNVLKFGFAS